MRLELKYISLAAAAFTLLLAFQNCGGARHEFKLGASSKVEFFKYPYDQAPKFYSDVQLFKDPAAPAGLSEFTVVVTSSYHDDLSANVGYEVRVRNENGTTVCPAQLGTFAAGSNIYMYDCVSAVSAATITVELKTTANGQTETFSRSY
jgi:hypothetical protein